MVKQFTASYKGHLLQMTSRPQLCFHSGPRKAANQVGDASTNCSDWRPPALPLTNQWRPWRWIGTPGELVKTLRNPPLRPPLRFPPARKRKKTSRKQCARTGEQLAPFPFPSYPSSSTFLTGTGLLNSKAVGSWQLVPGRCPKPVPKAQLFLTSHWAQAAQPGLSYCCFYAKPLLVSLSPV